MHNEIDKIEVWPAIDRMSDLLVREAASTGHSVDRVKTVYYCANRTKPHVTKIVFGFTGFRSFERQENCIPLREVSELAGSSDYTPSDWMASDSGSVSDEFLPTGPADERYGVGTNVAYVCATRWISAGEPMFATLRFFKGTIGLSSLLAMLPSSMRLQQFFDVLASTGTHNRVHENRIDVVSAVKILLECDIAVRAASMASPLAIARRLSSRSE